MRHASSWRAGAERIGVPSAGVKNLFWLAMVMAPDFMTVCGETRGAHGAPFSLSLPSTPHIAVCERDLTKQNENNREKSILLQLFTFIGTIPNKLDTWNTLKYVISVKISIK